MPALTIKATGIARQLVTDAFIHIPPGSVNAPLKVRAIWDTGATGCAITTNVVNSLGLAATGVANVGTANGVVAQNTYTIDIGLPGKVLIRGIVATEVPALTSGCDALIGMDVINLGDFSVTNHNGKTCMSFRLPSAHEIDYVKNPTYGLTPIVSGTKAAIQAKPSAANSYAGTPQNAPCPCGSGRQYKRCHGKRK